MKVEKCQSIARNGKPCSATPRPGRPYCAWHDPEAAEQRREWSRRGGAARSNRERARKQIPDALTTEELAGWLSVAFRKVLTGGMEPGVATAAATVARAVIAVSEAAALQRLEDRIDELERLAARRLA